MTSPKEKRKPLTWPDLPEEEKARLKRNEAAQRRETKARDLPAYPVSVEGLWMIQQGCCWCNECKGSIPLVPGDIVIAHPFYRAGKGSPGHCPGNVLLWSDACNRREAAKEARALGRGRRLAVDLNRKPKAKSKWSGSRPLPGTKASGLKRGFDGKVVKR